MRYLIAFVTLALLVAGCAGGPSPDIPKDAQVIGQRPVLCQFFAPPVLWMVAYDRDGNPETAEIITVTDGTQNFVVIWYDGKKNEDGSISAGTVFVKEGRGYARMTFDELREKYPNPCVFEQRAKSSA